jgi:PAS domain-containing protein
MAQHVSSLSSDPVCPTLVLKSIADAAIASDAQDIAVRVGAEEELRRANQTLRALIQASPLAIIALDARGRVTLWNPAAERTFGWREEVARPRSTTSPSPPTHPRTTTAASAGCSATTRAASTR